MFKFQTALVREKIVIDLTGNAPNRKKTDNPVIRSNRLDLDMLRDDGSRARCVVRAQNMHTTLRFAARIFLNFHKLGNFKPSNNGDNIDWNAVWDQCLSGYEKEYNGENIWGSVYVKGKPVFNLNDQKFMDVVEQCALVSKDQYDDTKDVVETLMNKLGQKVQVTQTTNVSATLDDTIAGEGSRCSMMHRSPDKNMIFTFMLNKGRERVDRIFHGMIIQANYLEVFNLNFLIQSLRNGIKHGTYKKNSRQARQLHSALNRKEFIKREIQSIESAYEVSYRPEKPSLF